MSNENNGASKNFLLSYVLDSNMRLKWESTNLSKEEEATCSVQIKESYDDNTTLAKSFKGR